MASNPTSRRPESASTATTAASALSYLHAVMSAPSVTTGQARVAREGRRAWTAKTRIGWSLLVLGAVLMVLFGAGKYYTFDSSVYFDVQRKVYENHTFWLMLHISGMVFAVLLGPWQFYRRLRERHFRLHRTLGKIYIAILRPALGQHTAYLIISWACWVPNLVFAEWLIRTKLRHHPEMPRMAQGEAAPMVSHAT